VKNKDAEAEDDADQLLKADKKPLYTEIKIVVPCLLLAICIAYFVYRKCKKSGEYIKLGS
jgi:hypothetical protein